MDQLFLAAEKFDGMRFNGHLTSRYGPAEIEIGPHSFDRYPPESHLTSALSPNAAAKATMMSVFIFEARGLRDIPSSTVPGHWRVPNARMCNHASSEPDADIRCF
jgi:hypothetical protein